MERQNGLWSDKIDNRATKWIIERQNRLSSETDYREMKCMIERCEAVSKSSSNLEHAMRKKGGGGSGEWKIEVVVEVENDDDSASGGGDSGSEKWEWHWWWYWKWIMPNGGSGGSGK